MTTATAPGVKAAQVAKELRFIEYSASTYVARPAIVSEPIEVFDPPRPASDAKGSMSNAELRELAKKNQPPQSWFEGEEEQLF